MDRDSCLVVSYPRHHGSKRKVSVKKKFNSCFYCFLFIREMNSNEVTFLL